MHLRCSCEQTALSPSKLKALWGQSFLPKSLGPAPASRAQHSSAMRRDAPLLVGHRGCGSDAFTAGAGVYARVRATENTALALVLASTYAAGAVEFDVQLTRDGVPVLYHDWGVLLPGVGHTGGGEEMPIRVPLGRLTLAQLQSLRTLPPLCGRGLRDEGASAAARAGEPTTPGQQGRGSADDGVSVHQRARRSRRACDALGLDVPCGGRHAHHNVDARAAAESAFLQRDYSFGVHDVCTTLASVLSEGGLPPSLGCNIELKYPSASESAAHGLNPVSREVYVAAVMAVVSQHAAPTNPRALVFSSFDPDVCALMAARHAEWPTHFLTEGGGGSGAPLDPRKASLEAALDFAAACGLQGVVTHVDALAGEPARWVDLARSRRLALSTYGAGNNTVAVALSQADAGVAMLIVDDVPRVAAALKRWGAADP